MPLPMTVRNARKSPDRTIATVVLLINALPPQTTLTGLIITAPRQAKILRHNYMPTRHLIIIVAVISGLIVLGVILFLLFINPGDQTAPGSQTEPDTLSVSSQLPLAGPASVGFSGKDLTPYPPDHSPYQKPRLVSDLPLIDASLGTSDQQIHLVTKEDKKLGSLNLTSHTFNATNVLDNSCAIIRWSPDGRHIAVMNQAEPQIITLETGQTTPLSPDIKNLIFSPAGDKIAYQYYSPEKQLPDLSIADVNGQNFTRIAYLNGLTSELSDTVILHAWSPDNYIYVSAESSGISAQPLNRVKIADHSRQPLVEWKSVRALQYSPQGHILAAEIFGPDPTDETQNYRPRLATINPDSGKQNDLGIGTFLEKCAWSHDEKSLYCALSADLDSTQSQEVIVKIGIDTKQQTQITGIFADQNFNLRHPFVSHDDRTLYFINNLDNKLYSVDL